MSNALPVGGVSVNIALSLAQSDVFSCCLVDNRGRQLDAEDVIAVGVFQLPLYNDANLGIDGFHKDGLFVSETAARSQWTSQAGVLTPISVVQGERYWKAINDAVNYGLHFVRWFGC